MNIYKLTKCLAMISGISIIGLACGMQNNPQGDNPISNNQPRKFKEIKKREIEDLEKKLQNDTAFDIIHPVDKHTSNSTNTVLENISQASHDTEVKSQAIELSWADLPKKTNATTRDTHYRLGTCYIFLETINQFDDIFTSTSLYYPFECEVISRVWFGNSNPIFHTENEITLKKDSSFILDIYYPKEEDSDEEDSDIDTENEITSKKDSSFILDINYTKVDDSDIEDSDKEDSDQNYELSPTYKAKIVGSATSISFLNELAIIKQCFPNLKKIILDGFSLDELENIYSFLKVENLYNSILEIQKRAMKDPIIYNACDMLIQLIEGNIILDHTMINERSHSEKILWDLYKKWIDFEQQLELPKSNIQTSQNKKTLHFTYSNIDESDAYEKIQQLKESVDPEKFNRFTSNLKISKHNFADTSKEVFKKKSYDYKLNKILKKCNIKALLTQLEKEIESSLITLHPEEYKEDIDTIILYSFSKRTYDDTNVDLIVTDKTSDKFEIKFGNDPAKNRTMFYNYCADRVILNFFHKELRENTELDDSTYYGFCPSGSYFKQDIDEYNKCLLDIQKNNTNRPGRDENFITDISNLIENRAKECDDLILTIISKINKDIDISEDIHLLYTESKKSRPITQEILDYYKECLQHEIADLTKEMEDSKNKLIKYYRKKNKTENRIKNLGFTLCDLDRNSLNSYSDLCCSNSICNTSQFENYQSRKTIPLLKKQSEKLDYYNYNIELCEDGYRWRENKVAEKKGIANSLTTLETLKQNEKAKEEIESVFRKHYLSNDLLSNLGFVPWYTEECKSELKKDYITNPVIQAKCYNFISNAKIMKVIFNIFDLQTTREFVKKIIGLANIISANKEDNIDLDNLIIYDFIHLARNVIIAIEKQENNNQYYYIGKHQVSFEQFVDYYFGFLFFDKTKDKYTSNNVIGGERVCIKKLLHLIKIAEAEEYFTSTNDANYLLEQLAYFTLRFISLNEPKNDVDCEITMSNE